MKGFFGGNIHINNPDLQSGDFSFKKIVNQQFTADKFFEETDEFILGIDGVILNKTKLASNREEWIQFFLNSDKNLSQKLLLLKGVFHGFIYHKESQELTLFNDPTGNKNFNFYLNRNTFAFAPDDITLMALLKDNSLEIDSSSIYHFLAYGYLGATQSWVTNSQRLAPGSILTYKNNHVSIARYKKFISSPKTHTNYRQALGDLETLLCDAISLQYDKDIENNKQHFTTLSGGLDSRVTTLFAHELGYTQQTAFTCSQSGYADHTIAKEIAQAYDFEHLFYPLDEFHHLFDIDTINQKIGGSAIYSGPSHVIFGIEKFWNDSFGLIHSGHIGDGVMGAFLSAPREVPANLNYGRTNAKLFPHIKEYDKLIETKYANEEEYKLYERAFCGAASGVWGLEDYSYNISPFIDTEVLDFLLELPYDFKYKRKIYVDWIIKYHPKWTQFKLESLHSKPNATWKFKYQNEYLRARFGFQKLISKRFRNTFTMVPEQYWFDHSKALQQYYSKEYNTALQIAKELNLPFHEELEAFYHTPHFETHAKALHLAYIINLIYKNE